VSKRVAQKQANRVVREQLAAERRRTRTLWITIGAVLVLLIAGIVGWGMYKSQQPDDFASPAGVTDVGGDKGGLTVAGSGSVPVEVYLDFLCPACRNFEASTSDTLDQLVAQGKIHLVWHTLGFLDSASAPPGYSTRAANAAGCASDGGKLAEYGAALFASQPAEGGPGLTDDQLVDLGGPVGLNAPSFAQCVRNGTYTSWVENVNAEAAQRNVNSTPTVYVDGKLLENPTPDSIRAAVTAAG
jgi:protein-disulfide isomerase